MTLWARLPLPYFWMTVHCRPKKLWSNWLVCFDSFWFALIHFDWFWFVLINFDSFCLAFIKFDTSSYSEVPNKRVTFSPASLAWACWEKCNTLIRNFRVENLDDFEVLSSIFPGLRTWTASLTSTASVTSTASSTATSLFQQRTSWPWWLDNPW